MRLSHSLAAVAAATTLLLSPAVASAALPQPAIGNIDAPSVGYLVDVAESYWSPNACAGRTQVHAVTTAEAVATTNDQAVAAFAAGIGSAFWPLPSCDVWIATDAYPQWSVSVLCHVLVHEIGHDLGLTHSPDPADVMYRFVGEFAPWICTAAEDRMQPVVADAAAVDARVSVPIDDHDEAPLARPAHWPTPRVLRIGRDARGRVALRVANAASPRLTVRFYRGREFGGRVVKTVVARVRRAAFEDAAATAIVVPPARWDAIDVQLTGGKRKASTGRWLRASAVRDWPQARGPVSGQPAPSASAEFGNRRKARPAPVLVGGGCGNPLHCR